MIECTCDPKRPRKKYEFSVQECKDKRECMLEEQECRACGKTKPMPIPRYWCDECFYFAHGWC